MPDDLRNRLKKLGIQKGARHLTPPLNHKTADLATREKVRIGADMLPRVLLELRARVPEGVILSTCNRFEILARDADREQLIEFVSSICDVPRAAFESSLYCYKNEDAVRHVFRVASSLDSMVIGESQILGQMKQAFVAAQEAGALHGGALHSVLERAIAVARRVRTETTIAEKPVSVSSVAVDLALRVFGSLESKSALVIGAGKMSALSIRHLQGRYR